MQHFSVSPRELLASPMRNRGLIVASVVREVLGRYRGSFMGLFWSLFNPLLMLSVYTFVFSEVFKARWSPDGGSRTEFALVLFAGLIVFNLFAECVNRAPMLVLGNVNYVKKVVFPLEVLPWVALGGGVFHMSISLLVWLVGYMVFYGTPNGAILYVPIILLPFLLFIVGLSWMLASLGVYLRDVSQVVNVITTVLLFMSPVFYPASTISEDYRYLLFLNPITPVIEMVRDALFWGRAPDFARLSVQLAASVVVAWVGFFWFQRTRKGFADVM